MVTTNVRRSTMVRPIEPTPRHRLWLSNVDLVSPRVPEKVVYFYRPDGSPDFFDATQLRDALARVLVLFYPVVGRIAKDEVGRMHVDCNEEGVLFVEAESGATVDDFGDFSPTVMLKHLIPGVGHADDLSSCPLLLLQVTYFRCGGVSLGVTFNHQLFDGRSFFHFINSWSDVARGADVKVAPFVDRTLLRARSPPTPGFDHVEYQPPPSLRTNSQCDDITTRPAAKIFKLTREHLNLLIKGSHCPPGAVYSKYVVVAAHVWRCVCISRDLPPDQETQLYITVDGRRRLSPPLKKGYFGNALFVAKTSATAGEMTKCLDEGHVQMASRIHEAIARIDDEYMRSALDYLEVQEPNLDAFARGAHQHRSPNFRLTSWGQLPFHDADFKWGRPVFSGPGCMSHEGMAYLMPSSSHDGSLSLAICLEPQHMLKFEKLIYNISCLL